MAYFGASACVVMLVCVWVHIW